MINSRGIEANSDKIQAVLNMKPPRNIKEVQQLIGCITAVGRFMSRSADKCQPFFRVCGGVLTLPRTKKLMRPFRPLKHT